MGLVVVFELHGSGALTSSRHTLSPAADVVIGAVAVAVARSRAWLQRRGRLIMVVVTAALGVVLIVRGAVSLSS